MKNWKIIGGATLLTVALAIGAAGEAWASHLMEDPFAGYAGREI